jgi:tryptophan-rich sensory protein
MWLIVFFWQLLVNLSWNLVFFAARRPGAALVDIGLLDLGATATAVSFAKVRFWTESRGSRSRFKSLTRDCFAWGSQVDPVAGALFLPYLACALCTVFPFTKMHSSCMQYFCAFHRFIGFATALNYSICKKNPDAHNVKPDPLTQSIQDGLNQVCLLKLMFTEVGIEN